MDRNYWLLSCHRVDVLSPPHSIISCPFKTCRMSSNWLWTEQSQCMSHLNRRLNSIQLICCIHAELLLSHPNTKPPLITSLLPPNPLCCLQTLSSSQCVWAQSLCFFAAVTAAAINGGACWLMNATTLVLYQYFV